MSAAKTLAGKIAIITGGSKGIGAATARHFVAEGAKVTINYNSDSATADKLVAELGADNAVAVQADAGDLSGVDKIVDTTVSRWGRIDIAVANAGLMLMRDLASTTPKDFDVMFATNVRGPFFLAQKAVQHMPKDGGGRIILLSTSVTKISVLMPSYTLYVATKGAIEQMVRGMAKELGPSKITANVVAPGPTDTELFHRGKTPEMVKGLENAHPQKRIGSPDELADVLTFVAGPKSSWVSGQTIFVNGGMAV